MNECPEMSAMNECPTCTMDHSDEVGFFDLLGNLLTKMDTMDLDTQCTKQDVINSVRNHTYIMWRMFLTTHMNVHLAMHNAKHIDPS